MNKKQQKNNATASLPIEIIQNGQAIVSPLTTDELEQIVEQAEKQIQIVEKIKNLCIRLTNKNDWILEGDTPYLTLTGATKIRERFGINIKVLDAKKEILSDEKGKYWYVEVRGQAELRGAVVEDVGVATSRDKFFGKEYGKLKDFEDIDVSNIIKKAYTNLQNRLIKKILGFFPTLEDLQNHGINLSEVRKIEFQEVKLTDDEKRKQREIMEMLADITDNNLDEAKRILKEASSFKNKNGEVVDGVEEVEMLRGTRLNITHHKVKELKEQKEKEAKEHPIKLIKGLIEKIKNERKVSDNGIITYLNLEGDLRLKSLDEIENLSLDNLRKVYKLLVKEVTGK